MEHQQGKGKNLEPSGGQKSRYGDIRRMVEASALFFGLGFFLAANVGVCIWLGQSFDEHFGTAPNGLLTGIVLGFPIAILSLWKKMWRKK